MIQKELTCISCPMGCNIIVSLENGTVQEITGNTCIKGREYAQKECLNPSRIVTTTVKVINGSLPVVSVKTQQDIPKEMIRKCMEELKKVTVMAPVKVGEIICSNIAGTGVNVVATKEIIFKED